jgi:alpha-1,2-mannosyltransferase
MDSLSSSLPKSRSARALAGAAVALVAAGWAAWHYADKLHSAWTANQAPHDLDVFLHAAARLVHGESPYAYRGDATYAYPPLLGYLATPFHAVGATAATFAWMLLSLAAIALALWWLGVRDWRCYGLTALFPFTRSAVDLGTVGPFLLLAVAAVWRWRDDAPVASLATGAGVALKLFLWPLLAWLVLTRRLLAAVGAVVCAALLVLVPWAAIGFADLADYPGLLRHLSRDEATSSYSVEALVVRAHLPETVGVVVSLLVAAALLAAAAWFRREGDAVTLTLAIAAALAASPIVWIHYFLLLLVPLALARPRLSWLWLVPFAYWPLGETAWPTGDARKLALALVTTLVLLAAPLGRVVARSAR